MVTIILIDQKGMSDDAVTDFATHRLNGQFFVFSLQYQYLTQGHFKRLHQVMSQAIINIKHEARERNVCRVYSRFCEIHFNVKGLNS